MQTKEYNLVLSLVSPATSGRRALIGLNLDGRVIGANREARSLLNVHNLTENNLSLQEILSDSQHLLSSRHHHTSELMRLNLSLDNNEVVQASVLLDRRPCQSAVSPSRQKQIEKPIDKPPSKSGETISRSALRPTTQWQAHYCFGDIFANDESFLNALHLARRAAHTDYTVLVHGETGVGKEMVSQAVHNESTRKEFPFVSLNCGAMSPALIESELFGYESGAFTGAKHGGSKGKFELAHQGTLFLDEIAEMPQDMQTKMLRVLQEGYIVRIGGTKPIPVDVRVIAATHRDLWDEVQAGRFRRDLFFRLQGIQVHVPPLRAREDLLNLIDYLLPKVQRELNLSSLSLTPRSKELLLKYPWPGNVRELESVLRESAFLAEGCIIDVLHLPLRLRQLKTVLTSPLDGSNMSNGTNSLHEQEHQMIIKTVEQSHGNLSEAARRLGISRSTLYRKLQATESQSNV